MNNIIINKLNILKMKIDNLLKQKYKHQFNEEEKTNFFYYEDEFIYIINLIRNQNIEKANIVNLPIMTKNHLQFNNNYNNFYQYLYIFLDDIDRYTKENLLNTIVNIAYLF